MRLNDDGDWKSAAASLAGDYDGCLTYCPMNDCKNAAQSLHRYGFGIK